MEELANDDQTVPRARAAPVPRTDHKEMEQVHPGLKTVPEMTEMTPARPLMTTLRMTSEMAPPPLTLSITALTRCLSAGGWGKSAFGQMSTTLRHMLPASEIRQTFLSTNWPGFWLLSDEQPDLTHIPFDNMLSY